MPTSIILLVVDYFIYKPKYTLKPFYTLYIPYSNWTMYYWYVCWNTYVFISLHWCGMSAPPFFRCKCVRQEYLWVFGSNKRHEKWCPILNASPAEASLCNKQYDVAAAPHTLYNKQCDVAAAPHTLYNKQYDVAAASHTLYNKQYDVAAAPYTCDKK